MAENYPKIRVGGSPTERGLSYGQQAASRIYRNLEIYQEMFHHVLGWTWTQVTTQAKTLIPVIEGYRPHFIEEMKAIAHGAGVTFEDILALNTRTEIRNAAIAQIAVQECTAFVSLGNTNVLGHTLLGQNWDWVVPVRDTVVILEAAPSKGPKFITIVEAGMLAKTGMNEAGLGLVTNALHADIETNQPKGVPYHLILRAILESETLSEAIHAVTSHPRASSANYMVSHKDGETFNAEAAPGDYANVTISFIEDFGAHTNHYLHRHPGFKDLGPWHGPDSLVRHHRMHKYLKNSSESITVVGLQGALADHFNYPNAICSHPDLGLPEPEHFATIFSVIMDLTTRTIWLAEGNPCEKPFRETRYQSFFSQASA